MLVFFSSFLTYILVLYLSADTWCQSLHRLQEILYYSWKKNNNLCLLYFFPNKIWDSARRWKRVKLLIFVFSSSLHEIYQLASIRIVKYLLKTMQMLTTKSESSKMHAKKSKINPFNIIKRTDLFRTIQLKEKNIFKSSKWVPSVWIITTEKKNYLFSKWG